MLKLIGTVIWSIQFISYLSTTLHSNSVNNDRDKTSKQETKQTNKRPDRRTDRQQGLSIMYSFYVLLETQAQKCKQFRLQYE